MLKIACFMGWIWLAHWVLPFNLRGLSGMARLFVSACFALSWVNLVCDRSTSLASVACAVEVRRGCHGMVAKWVEMPKHLNRRGWGPGMP